MHSLSHQDKPRTGRPTRLTAEVSRAFCECIRAGCPERTAAALAGVSYDAAREWIRRGLRRSTRPYRKVYGDFAQAVAKARAEFAWALLRRIWQALRTDGPEPWEDPEGYIASGRWSVLEATYRPRQPMRVEDLAPAVSWWGSKRRVKTDAEGWVESWTIRHDPVRWAVWWLDRIDRRERIFPRAGEDDPDPAPDPGPREIAGGQDLRHVEALSRALANVPNWNI